MGGQHAAVVVVGRDVADDLRRFQARVEDHDRDSLGDRRLDRLDQRPGVERGQHDAVDPAGDRVLDELDLLRRSSSFWGPARSRRHSQLVGRLERAGMDRLPELVGRPLGNHDHPPFLLLLPKALASVVFSTWGGWINLAISGSSMFSGVTSVSPVEILGSTGFFSRCLTIVLTRARPSVGVLDHQALDFPLPQRIDQRLAGVEADEDHALPGRHGPGFTPSAGPPHPPAKASVKESRLRKRPAGT